MNLGDRFIVLVDQIHGGVRGVESVWLERLDVNFIFVNLEPEVLFQTTL